MRVLQLIDTLNAGGAERMVVNIANSLSENIEFSGIVATRKGGDLEKFKNNKVSLYILHKKHTLDFVSFKNIIEYIKSKKIDLVHAHGTSIFMAFVLKLYFRNKLKVVWHDHLGARIDLKLLKNIPILIFCLFFDLILVVNKEMENWYNSKKYKSIFFPNFATFEEHLKCTKLKGIEGERLVCVANLKNPKNHHFILEVFRKIWIKYPNWTLHFVGKDFNDDYSRKLKEGIVKYNLKNHVFIYGSRNDISNILSQSTIGVLASTSEGFPVSILEYGLAKLPVIVSNVGFNDELIYENENGFLFNLDIEDDFYNKLERLILNLDLRFKFGSELYKFVTSEFDQVKIINKLKVIYSKCIYEN